LSPELRSSSAFDRVIFGSVGTFTFVSPNYAKDLLASAYNFLAAGSAMRGSSMWSFLSINKA